MRKVSGSCHCGNVRVDLELAREPVTYHPRACDCDFCRKHGAAYVSDPQGSLSIRVRDAVSMSGYRQGSGAAECIFCRNCGVLIGVLYRSDGRIWGAINVKIVESLTTFGTEEVVSPKALSGNEKEKRWRDIWFSNVTIECVGPGA
ncbi:MAG: aldehyde-activating protein [Gammaproteobacteria bacterium]|nr:aldehyde-activating protein [Gammaproteobacteria bacterium]